MDALRIQPPFLKSNLWFSHFPNYFCYTVGNTRKIHSSTIRISASSKNPPRVSLGRANQRISTSHKPPKRRNSLREKLIREGKVKDPDFFSYRTVLHDENNLAGKDITHENLNFLRENGLIGDGDELELLREDWNQPVGSDSSELLSKLENWASQYKEDVENWGIGSGPIFLVHRDSSGKIRRVSVNEKEIVERSSSVAFSDQGNDDSGAVIARISRAKAIARNIEEGLYTLPRDSSVVKFIEFDENPIVSIREGIRELRTNGVQFSKISRIGFAFLCGFLIFGAVKKLFASTNGNSQKLSSIEEEMLWRKLKARKEKEVTPVRGEVEVLESVSSHELQMPGKRPQLDNDELMEMISKVRTSEENSGSLKVTRDKDHFHDKIMEIRRMAREVRKREQSSLIAAQESESNAVNGFEDVKTELGSAIITRAAYDFGETIEKDAVVNKEKFSEIQEGDSGSLSLIFESVHNSENEDVRVIPFSEEATKEQFKPLGDSASNDIDYLIESGIPGEVASADRQNINVVYASAEVVDNVEQKPRKLRSKIITSVAEATQYLETKRGVKINGSDNEISRQADKFSVWSNIETEIEEETPQLSAVHANEDLWGPKPVHVEARKSMPMPVKETSPRSSDLHAEVMYASRGELELARESKEFDIRGFQADAKSDEDLKHVNFKNDSMPSPASKEVEEVGSLPDLSSFSADSGDVEETAGHASANPSENWLEKNFDKFEPVLQKISAGFRDNYLMAKEKVQEELDLVSEIHGSGFDDDYDELDWMKDDTLREIVQKVSENEMAGRDPFYLMDSEDQEAFFKGLDRKVEKVNAKMLKFHEWVHANVENLDYGSDGISIYDPPEKIIPRWRGSPVTKDPEFLKDFNKMRDEILSRKRGIMSTRELDTQVEKEDSMGSLPSIGDGGAASSDIHVPSPASSSEAGPLKNPKTIIEGSDGSLRRSTKSAKEHWQHTKRWSQEFLDVYNNETDPEVKSIMKNMGKDLDRWITEKEIQEAADFMDGIPKKEKHYLQNKLDKFKRECETYGSPAVLSKYREYAEEQAEDYLWWLDLRYVLCIEIKSSEEGYERIGFYSLEMAPDLGLDPKQYHVIAFEAVGDARNFCFSIQQHMDRQGKGETAFVIPRSPKDAFREAKANGFSVTVIRKGELKLNIDQTLEDMEEEIVELGSDMYNKKLMKERSVSMDGLIKGVFNLPKRTKRRKKISKRLPR